MANTLMIDLLQTVKELKEQDRRYKTASAAERAKMGRKSHGGSKKKVKVTSTAK